MADYCSKENQRQRNLAPSIYFGMHNVDSAWLFLGFEPNSKKYDKENNKEEQKV